MRPRPKPPFIAAGYGLANQERTAILAAIQAGDVDRAGQAAATTSTGPKPITGKRS